MAYTGFLKLCRCLWSSSTQELHSKPATWVQELLESLQSTSLTRLLSITRRSAGLPFYLQVHSSYCVHVCTSLPSLLVHLLKVLLGGGGEGGWLILDFQVSSAALLLVHVDQCKYLVWSFPDDRL